VPVNLLRRVVRAAGMAIQHEASARNPCEALSGSKDYVRTIQVLDAAGVWDGVPVAEKNAIIAILTSSESTYEEWQQRWAAGGIWHADGEDLGKGDVEEWLGGLAPALAECGVDLHVTTVDPCEWGSPGYAVAVNGKTLELYRFDPGDPRLPATEDPWMDCSIVPAAEVNRLLEETGSDRRLALIWQVVRRGSPCSVLKAPYAPPRHRSISTKTDWASSSHSQESNVSDGPG